MAVLVFVPKPVPSIGPMLCNCEKCRRTTPQFLYTTKGSSVPLPILLGAAVRAASAEKISLICYDCFNIKETGIEKDAFINSLRSNETYSYMFRGNVAAYNTAREAINSVLDAAQIQQSGRYYPGRKKDINRRLEAAIRLKESNNKSFSTAIAYDLSLMSATLPKKCPRCAETVKAEALICRFCGYEFPAKTEEDEEKEAFSEYEALSRIINSRNN